MDMAADYGVNFIDTAEMYAIPPRPETYGLSEKIIGNWLLSRGNREKTVLATKVVGRGDHNSGVGHIRGGPRLSRQHIVEAAESSLKRLKTRLYRPLSSALAREADQFFWRAWL